jgi:hypothetical protein
MMNDFFKGVRNSIDFVVGTPIRNNNPGTYKVPF